MHNEAKPTVSQGQKVADLNR